MPQDKNIVTMFEVFAALEALIKAAGPAHRRVLAEAIDGFAEQFPGDFLWAVGPQSPTLLHNLLMAIDAASSEEGKPRSRVVRFVAGNERLGAPAGTALPTVGMRNSYLDMDQR
jgi:hypothetical protein